MGLIWVHQQKLITEKKDILILGIGPTQRLEHTLGAEKLYSINFTKKNTKFCLSLHYNVVNSYLFVNGTEIIKFKAKDSEILAMMLYFILIIITIIVMILYFILLVLTKINLVVIVMILMIHMQEFAFLIW